MKVPTYLLFILGVLGGLDVLFFHSIAHGIRHHSDSRKELILHSLRGPVYGLLFLIVPNVILLGAYWWVLVVILTIDFLITVFDFAVEKRSREMLGGLPTIEYILHLLMAVLFGAFVMALWSETMGWRTLPSSIWYSPANVWWPIRVMLALMAVLVILSGLLDVLAANRLSVNPSEAQTGSGKQVAG